MILSQTGLVPRRGSSNMSSRCNNSNENDYAGTVEHNLARTERKKKKLRIKIGSQKSVQERKRDSCCVVYREIAYCVVFRLPVECSVCHSPAATVAVPSRGRSRPDKPITIEYRGMVLARLGRRRVD